MPNSKARAAKKPVVKKAVAKKPAKKPPPPPTRRPSGRVPNLAQPLDLSRVKLSKDAKGIVSSVAADAMLKSVLGQ